MIALRLLALSLLLTLAVSFVSMPAQAAPANVSLDSGWQFRAFGSNGHPDTEQWHPASVPGGVHTDLLANKLIPDPFYRNNEADLQWIGLNDWEYQKTFDVDQSLLQHAHVDLVFNGLDTYADVFLNGEKLASTDNMFRRWRIPAKAKLHSGSNTLRIVFHSPVKLMMPQVKAAPYRLPTVLQIQQISEDGIATDPYTRKAGYNYGWDWGPRYITMGLWKPVQLHGWDDARIEAFHIQQKKVTKEEADLAAEFDIVSSGGSATLSVGYDAAGGKIASVASSTVHLDNGVTKVSLPFKITAPALWYPNGYGQQPLYHFTASLSSGDKADVRTGLRSLELRREAEQWGKSFAFYVNGIPIFAKGADVIPFDSFPTRVTKEQQRQILTSARDAHMNMIRHWGGGYYESDDFYNLCDELGIMVWQDFMFGGEMVPGDPAFQDNVREEITQQVKRLRDHPSISLFSGNNELETGWVHWGDRQAFKLSVSAEQREKVWQDYVVLFHDIIKSIVKEDGGGIPYWPSSPSANFEDEPDNPRNGDMHYWQVWHALVPIKEYEHQFPRFMSEYGFQSFPEMRTIKQFAEPGDLDLLSPVMQAHQKNVGGNERIRAYMLREYHEPKDFDSFIYVSQVLQANAIKVGAEHLRRNRPRTMGSLYWQLNDCWPVASWSSIDYYGRWKALHYYAKRFYDDVLVSPWEDDTALRVSIVSDRQNSTPADLRVRLLDFDGKSYFDKKTFVQIPALSAREYVTFTRTELLRGVDPKKAVAVFEVVQDGKVVARNLYYFDRVRNLALPKPNISAQLSGGNGSYTLELRAPTSAREVYVNFGDNDVQMSDNYVDLLPNEPMTITVKSGASLDSLKQAMKVRDITTAFPTGE